MWSVGGDLRNDLHWLVLKEHTCLRVLGLNEVALAKRLCVFRVLSVKAELVRIRRCNPLQQARLELTEGLSPCAIIYHPSAPASRARGPQWSKKQI